MTTKEKAKELVEKFRFYLGNSNDGEEFYVDDLDAKQCALICVDEILKSLNNIEGQHSTLYEEEDYFKEVKQEIEKL